MKGKIYTVATKITYDLMTYRLFRKEKFLKQDEQVDMSKPIFAYNSDEAVEKYKKRHRWNTIQPLVWGNPINNIKREVVVTASHNGYTFDQLKECMNSQDFLEYCRQELLDVNEVVS